MTNILNRLLTKNKTLSSVAGLERLTFRKSVLKTLVDARKNETLVGIYADALGEGMFVTGVEHIQEADGDQIIQLKNYDIIGTILIQNRIPLSEIKAICAFDMRYKDPYSFENLIKPRH